MLLTVLQIMFNILGGRGRNNIVNKVFFPYCIVFCCFMLTFVRRFMADSDVGRSFRLVVDRVNAATRSRSEVHEHVILFATYDHHHLFENTGRLHTQEGSV